MKKLIYTIIPLLLLVLIIPQNLDAQYRRGKKKDVHRFNAGAVLGLNISQMDGDLYTGFDKLGLKVGAKGSVYLNKKLDLVFGLMYSQQGSRFDNAAISSAPVKKDRAIKLQYMEVPVLLNLKFNEEKEKGYTLELGFSYGRLFDYKIVEINQPNRFSYATLADDFNDNDFSAIAGINYNFSSHFAIGLQGKVQLNKLYKKPGAGSEPNPDIEEGEEINLLRNYLISVKGIYTIF